MNRRTALLCFICFLLPLTLLAQEEKKSAAAKTASAGNAATVLEAKIRKAWEDYKNRDKKAFAAILADGFGEVTNDAEGIASKDAEISEMDHFNLAHYDLKDFKLRPVANSGAVMTYVAEYSGSYDNTPLQMKAMYGEVWIKAGNDRKLLWVQETKLK